MSKIPENVVFGQKKSACGMPAQTKIAFKHISEYSRPNSDQIPYKTIHFDVKNCEHVVFFFAKNDISCNFGRDKISKNDFKAIFGLWLLPRFFLGKMTHFHIF